IRPVMTEESSSICPNFVTRRKLSTRDRAGNGTVMFSLTDNDDVQFDTSDSDSNCELLMAGRQYPSIQEFASAIPNHLLLGSLLEHLCFVYESDPTRSRMLFKAIGQRLAAMNLLSPLAISDEFSTVRLQHNRAFTELLHAASSSLLPQVNTSTCQRPVILWLEIKDGLFQAQTSRYLSEFEEISALGKGSYGKVFKVKNKLDGQNYAVKKILIKNVTRDDCIKVLREVKVLSSLQHPNIVGYHTAWMEHVQPAGKNPKPFISNAFPALGTSSQREGCLRESTDSTSGSFIVFESSEHSKDINDQPACALDGMSLKSTMSNEEGSHAMCAKSVRNPQNFVPCVFLGKPGSVVDTCPALSWNISALSEDEFYTDAASQPWAEKPPREVQFHLMLYIQMQLCERSLKDWIHERNCRPKAELTASTGPCQPFDSKQASAILKKILEGVAYIHSRGIMHRDLKPRNIFLHGNDYHVKIGDFGLACKDIVVNEKEQLPLNSHTGNNTESHTTGVGTFIYASPEQLEGSHYDLKSDMYSVGMVAAELFQPFGTEMERVHTLGDLRQGKVPETLCGDWPVLTKYIRLLTSSDPSLRPSASQLLQSDLFNTQDMVIHSLQRRIDEQEEEIFQLRKQISQLQTNQYGVENSTKKSK
uniref:Eukaryotic translation initiation factor 2-alpha kinase 1 n=1 Tax=Electrophorus electricus TaxID=8005 RepID=A0A4W4F964_ELEEL